jgi:D-proline reductase (dithiol) PrdB
MEILENREEIAAAYAEFADSYQDGKFNWKFYQYVKNKTNIPGNRIDLSQSRLAIISTAGGYLPESQESFDVADPYGDYGIRTFPITTPLDKIAYAHEHYDHTAVNDDPQVLLPFHHLETMVAEGAIGELAPSVINFMGYQPDIIRIVDELFPAILKVLKEEQVQAALLIPA